MDIREHLDVGLNSQLLGHDSGYKELDIRMLRVRVIVRGKIRVRVGVSVLASTRQLRLAIGLGLREGYEYR